MIVSLVLALNDISESVDMIESRAVIDDRVDELERCDRGVTAVESFFGECLHEDSADSQSVISSVSKISKKPYSSSDFASGRITVTDDEVSNTILIIA